MQTTSFQFISCAIDLAKRSNDLRAYNILMQYGVYCLFTRPLCCQLFLVALQASKEVGNKRLNNVCISTTVAVNPNSELRANIERGEEVREEE